MMKTLRSLALAGIVALAAFCAKDKSAWQGTIEEVEGVTIVRNPAKPVLEGSLFTLEEELSIGDEDGSRAIAFSDISHLTADDQGWIYALDRKESCVQVFDADGRHLRTIGQPGQGPGDLNEPIFVYFLRGELLVTQYERLSFFSPAGDLLRTVPMVKETPSRARCNSRGNIIGTSSVFDPATPETYAFVLKLYDPEITPIRELARVQMKRRIGGPVNPMRPTVYMTVDDQDRVIFAYADKYEIQVFDPDGTLTRKILKAYDPVTVTAEEKAASVDGAPPQIKFDFPEHHSPFLRFIHDEAGRLYVQTYEKAGGTNVYVHDVFDPEGRFIARVPLKRTPVLFRGGKLYSLEESEEGYPVIKRYRVVGASLASTSGRPD
ncbi:MAG: hypothetical protein A2W03_12345 [Candidatus Aminicenantes bacterium RBG_16_63_16]|nr:MAG: hypothetical protein A2W03_12345 [Candidatus Aminicenantes bacterium RBG_16_63_16]